MRAAMKRALLLALALLPACTQAKAPPPPAARPALWKVVDRDTTVYLFGTIHVLPKGMVWVGPKLNAAMAASSGLVLETVIPKDPAVLGGVMAKLGVSPGLPPLLDRVPPKSRAKLAKAVTESGVPLAALDKLETWAAGLALSASAIGKLGVGREDGAEAALTDRFARAGKPVSGLETPEQQLGYFDGLPEAAQRKFLVSIAEDASDPAKEFAAMIAAWRSGNVRQIALSFDDELKLSPELADALIARRNANWAEWVTKRMAQPGTLFVAVGAGHLAGKGSVEELLARRGLKVVRVQ